jgi:hypothetical protein
VSVGGMPQINSKYLHIFFLMPSDMTLLHILFRLILQTL